MNWFRDNMISVLLNVFVGLLMLYFTYNFNQRAEKIDSKADKEYVDIKNEAQDEMIKHNREILELNHAKPSYFLPVGEKIPF